MTDTSTPPDAMEATYDPEADALYVRFRVAPHGRTIEDGPHRLLHLDRDGEVYAVELLRVRHNAAEDASRLAGAAATYQPAGGSRVTRAGEPPS